jgi:hypothetical protein
MQAKWRKIKRETLRAINIDENGNMRSPPYVQKLRTNVQGGMGQGFHPGAENDEGMRKRAHLTKIH